MHSKLLCMCNVKQKFKIAILVCSEEERSDSVDSALLISLDFRTVKARKDTGEREREKVWVCEIINRESQGETGKASETVDLVSTFGLWWH